LSHIIPKLNYILAEPKQMSQRELEGQLGLITRLALPDIRRLIGRLVTGGYLELQTCLKKTGEIAEIYQIIKAYDQSHLMMSISYVKPFG